MAILQTGMVTGILRMGMMTTVVALSSQQTGLVSPPLQLGTVFVRGARTFSVAGRATAVMAVARIVKRVVTCILIGL